MLPAGGMPPGTGATSQALIPFLPSDLSMPNADGSQSGNATAYPRSAARFNELKRLKESARKQQALEIPKARFLVSSPAASRKILEQRSPERTDAP